MTALLDALMPKTRQDILAVTYLEPERSWYMSELARRLGVPPSSIQRELASLTSAGILARRQDGNRVLFQADPACPIGEELRQILRKTAAVYGPIEEALRPLLPRIESAFVYGSFARGEEHARSDIDLMVIGSVSLFDLSVALRPAQGRLGREVNITAYPPDEFAKKLRAGNHFLSTVMNGPKAFLKGSEDELGALVEREAGTETRHEPGGVGRPALGGRP
jgi:predicted nucleotidyltransferase